MWRNRSTVVAYYFILFALKLNSFACEILLIKKLEIEKTNSYNILCGHICFSISNFCINKISQANKWSVEKIPTYLLRKPDLALVLVLNLKEKVEV